MRSFHRHSRELIASFAIAAAAFAPAWVAMGHLFTQDWHYFNVLSWIVRSSVFHYGRLPLHDPWFCGGLDIVQNPQNRLLSPFGLLDLLFPPQWANLLSLNLYGFFGAYGMILLLTEELEASFTTAVTVSMLFIGSTWFGLHFTEGHIPFGSLQLLPWVYLFGRRLGRGSEIWESLLLLALVFALMILDGGIYAFVFSLMLLATLPFPRTAIAEISSSQRTLALAGLIGVACLCLSLSKMYPVLQALRHRVSGAELTLMTPRLFLESLFYPFQRIDLPMPPNTEFRFHEFGCYIGLFGPLVIAAMWASGALKQRARLWVPALLFLWIGSGFLDRFNPWNVFRRVPVLNNVHVQSRMFLIFLFLFLLMLTHALEALRKTRSARVYGAVLVLILAEVGVARASALSHLSISGGAPIRAGEFIQSDTIASTVEWAYGPSHLRTGQLGTQDCYEPSFIGVKVLKTGARNYRGEAFVSTGTGKVALSSYVPGRIEADYDVKEPSTLAFNTRVLAGWTATSPQQAIARPISGLLGVDVPAGAGRVVLEYTPHYLRTVLAFYFVGLFLFGLAWWLSLTMETKTRG